MTVAQRELKLLHSDESLSVELVAVSQKMCPCPSKSTTAEDPLDYSQSSSTVCPWMASSPGSDCVCVCVLHETSSNTHIKTELHNMAEAAC